MSLDEVKTVAERLRKHVGRIVVVEGTYPIPLQINGQQQIAFSPLRGKLERVFDDGIEVLDDGATETRIMPFTTIRSVYPVSDLVRPSIQMPKMPKG